MKAKIKKVFLWTLAAIFVLVAVKWSTGSPGGEGMYGMYAMHHSPHMHPGYDPGPFMWGHHRGGFHFLWSAVSLVFWLAAAAVLVIWLRKKIPFRSFSRSSVEAPVFDYTHMSRENQPDFLDEWEKKQLSTKEEK